MLPSPLRALQRRVKQRYAIDPIDLNALQAPIFCYIDGNKHSFFFSLKSISKYVALCQGFPKNPYTNLPMDEGSVCRLAHRYCRDQLIDSPLHTWIQLGADLMLQMLHVFLPELHAVMFLVWMQSRPDVGANITRLEPLQNLFRIRTKIHCMQYKWAEVLYLNHRARIEHVSKQFLRFIGWCYLIE